ncbi:MAG: hypothetical protein KatS3mg057_1010 [Herpetosiphonaceae bacterium]|nr:MAG: hypothetical protein KatS3mg057_1010 [Herpetosiphonaceae bacterium]
MTSNIGQQVGFCACPNCGYQLAINTGVGMWQGGMLPAGQMMGPLMGGQFPGTSMGMTGMMPTGTFAPGTTLTTGAFVPSLMTLGATADDESIKNMVYDAIDADSSIPQNADINVEVNGSIVTLTGSVPSKRIKHAVGDAAWWIPGVVDVNNQLQVQPRKERMRGERRQQAQH